MKLFETSKQYSLKKSIYINLRWIGTIGSPNILIKRMRELAFLNKGIKIIFTDLSNKKEKTDIFKFDGGVLEYRWLNNCQRNN